MKGRTSYGWRKVLPVYKEEAATLMGCTGAAKALMSTKMSSVKSAFSSPAPSCFNQEPSIDWQWTDWWGLLHELACAAGTSSATVCSEQTRWSHCFYDALLCLRQCDSLSKCISLILFPSLFLPINKLLIVFVWVCLNFLAITTACWLLAVPLGLVLGSR